MAKQIFLLVNEIDSDYGGALRILGTFASKPGAQAARRVVLAKAHAAELKAARSWLAKSQAGHKAHPDDSGPVRNYFEHRRVAMALGSWDKLAKAKAEGQALGIPWDRPDYAHEIRDARANIARLADFEAYIKAAREPMIITKLLKD